MNVLARNKTEIQYCSMYLNEDDIQEYKEPVSIKLNIQPITSSDQMLAYGEAYPLYLQATVTKKLLRDNKMKAGDKCYVYTKPPAEHDTLCKGADYIVDKEPLPTLNSSTVRFKRLASDMSYE